MSRSLRLAWAALVAGSLSALLPGWAADPAESIVAQGRGQTPACASCHGPHGEGGGDGLYPRIAGLPTSYVESQLKAFRDGLRANALMQPMLVGLTDEDLRDIAQYLSRQPVPYVSMSSPRPPQLLQGRTLVTIGAWERGIPPCASCHGPQLEGAAPAIPSLAGQWPKYLVAQLTAYQSGKRSNDPLGLMRGVTAGMTTNDIESVSAYLASLRPGEVPEPPRPDKPLPWTATPQTPDSFTPPPDAAIPAGPYGDLVRLGQSIFEDTPRYAGQYAGNALSCRNCHLDRGRAAQSSPMWAAYVHYPEYRKKDGVVNTMQMRIQGCFRYSQNGIAPAPDSPEITALVTYFHWLATGLPVGIKPKSAGFPKLAPPKQPPSPERGARVYAESCALCHGDDGQGRIANGHTVFPPLWGPRSFNWGAGMHQVDLAAAFIRSNMPYGAAGSLTEQQAWDVAAFVNSRPRPQDPRYADSVERTRERFHAGHEYDYYGREVDGVLLGAPEPKH